MSRSKQRGRRNRDWWGKRPLAGYPVSNNSKTDKFFKRLLHKIERKQGRKSIDDEIIQSD